MAAKSDILTFRESLDKIYKIPENHPGIPDRSRPPLLDDIFRKMAAPYRPDRVGNPIGQGYWVQA